MVIRATGAAPDGSTMDRRCHRWPPVLAWRPRLLARIITGIGWRPLTSMAGSFGRIRKSSQLPGDPGFPGAICTKEDQP